MNEEILIRFLIHRCTSEEIKVVDQWIASDQANADWLFEMERIWSLKDQLRFPTNKRSKGPMHVLCPDCRKRK